MTFSRNWLAALAVVVAAACATAPPEALTDGRGLVEPQGSPTTGPAPASVLDAGIRLPPDGANAPAPSVTGLTPPGGLVGGIAPTITVSGQNFLARTVIELDGTALATSVASGTSMSATLPSSLLATSGSHAITIDTPAPGGGRTSALAFTVNNPVATLTSIAPNAALIGAADTTVTITGTGFVNGSTTLFGAAVVPTTYVSPTQITIVVPQASLATSGSVPIVVSNPLPGGGPSTRLAFTVANPTVTITSIAPASGTVGAAGTTISAVGTGFVAASSVSFNGTAIPTTITSATALTATIPATSLTTTGAFPVVVTNPAPGGGVSLPVTFTVGNPDPTITTLTPSSAPAGSPPLTVTVDGTGFVTSSTVTFGGAASATTYVSATEVTAVLTADQLSTVGPIAVAVVNPAPGGGTSTPAATFTVDNPTPVLTSISPTSVAAGASDTTITAFGSSFVATSTVQASGTALATTFVSATELRAVVPAASLAAPTSIPITVANPDPGASTSSAQTLTVTAATTNDDAGTATDDGGGVTPACDPTGVDVALSATGATQTLTLAYTHGPSLRFFYDPSDLTESTCPVAQLSTSSSAYAALVVQNTSGATAFLEANADCASTDVAFLALYAGTTTVPTTDAARIACTGVVANGTTGGGGFSSANANGSQWCPGITKANGGSVTLQPCATAVILVQPYDVTEFTEPAQVDLDLTP